MKVRGRGSNDRKMVLEGPVESHMVVKYESLLHIVVVLFLFLFLFHTQTILSIVIGVGR